MQKKNKSEYLTEKQLVNDGPLLVDIDLRYDIEIDSRQHTSNHINDLIENYLSQIDLVLIMSVEPGFGGQKFMPEVLEKTKKVRNLIDKENLNVDVEIDGGINFENCSKVKDAGANILVSGSTVFKENEGDLKKNIEILRNS